MVFTQLNKNIIFFNEIFLYGTNNFIKYIFLTEIMIFKKKLELICH